MNNWYTKSIKIAQIAAPGDGTGDPKSTGEIGAALRQEKRAAMNQIIDVFIQQMGLDSNNNKEDVLLKSVMPKSAIPSIRTAWDEGIIARVDLNNLKSQDTKDLLTKIIGQIKNKKAEEAARGNQTNDVSGMLKSTSSQITPLIEEWFNNYIVPEEEIIKVKEQRGIA